MTNLSQWLMNRGLSLSLSIFLPCHSTFSCFLYLARSRYHISSFNSLSKESLSILITPRCISPQVRVKVLQAIDSPPVLQYLRDSFACNDHGRNKHCIQFIKVAHEQLLLLIIQKL